MRGRGWIGLLLLCGLHLSMLAQSEAVVFSTSGGFYAQPFQLSLECYYPNHTVHYTINGCRPTKHSPRYTDPLWLDNQLFSPSEIYKIPISPESAMFVPDSVSHAIVIRAAVFDENDVCISKVFTNTYVIHSLGGVNNGLPVLSICADSLALFDYETGIFVPGANWDSLNPSHSGNYFLKGREWERLANVEFYDPVDNSGINQECGLRAHGNRSRVYPNKGMKLYAREEYGAKRFRYKFYDDSPIESFKRLIVKPFSTLNPYVGIQDNICNRLALRLNMDASHSRPVRVYLNGEYWGIYFLQEKLDEHFLEDYYDVDESQCNIVENWDNEAEFGSAEGIYRLLNWMETADLRSDENYEYVDSLIDIGNLIDYFIFETFIANKDWPGNNVQCWQMADGKWTWAFFDGDYTLLNDDFDVFGNLTYTGDLSWPASTRSTLLFRRLIQNETFKTQFAERLDELCNTVLRYESTAPILYEIRDALCYEVCYQSERFGLLPSVDYWNWGVYLVDEFLKHRCESYRRSFEDFMEQLPATEVPYSRYVLYPNPSAGELFLISYGDASSEEELVVTDLVGRVVWREQVCLDSNRHHRISLDLSAGVYVLKIGGEAHKVVLCN